MDEPALIEYLRRHGLLSGVRAKTMPLAGGVSSDIVLVESDRECFVVKRPLEKLRVKDDWHCSTRRNTTEYNAIRYVGRFAFGSVPKLLHFDAEQRLFVMEYLGNGFTPWKSQLLGGVVNLAMAVHTAQVLAALHSHSWQDSEAKSQFDTGADFFALRIDPYLIATGKRHPDLMSMYQSEADRLLNTRLALVHGDWSAKNILVSADRTVVLDWEVAWFGDPAFDSAFFQALIHLKSIYNRQQAEGYFELLRAFRSTYAEHLSHYSPELHRHIARLTLMLLLARIDGKSPAEYITSEESKNFVRRFARRLLIEGVDDPDDVSRQWQKALQSL